MKVVAVYPGTFDPITKGHEDLIERSASLFGPTRVAVVRGGIKDALFSIDERVDMVERSVRALPGRQHISVEPFDGLLVDYVRSLKAMVVSRGLRAVADFEYEYQMALMNRKLAPSVEVIYLMPKLDYVYLSSSLVKEVARHGGHAKGAVSPHVEKALRERYR